MIHARPGVTQQPRLQERQVAERENETYEFRGPEVLLLPRGPGVPEAPKSPKWGPV